MHPESLKNLPENLYNEMKLFLDEVVEQVETQEYIATDPVSFLHSFNEKEDQLIAGFFAAIMAWGRRDIVLKKVHDLLERMDYRPGEFVKYFQMDRSTALNGFKHRTFSGMDVEWMCLLLHTAIKQHGSFENFWKYCYGLAQSDCTDILNVFHPQLFKLNRSCPTRVRKHIADRNKNSSCKRLYLFLRWTMRSNSVVDFRLMDFMPESELKIPLDVHVARQARKLGLLTRTQNDAKAVDQLTDLLKLFDRNDPSRYDFALFGIGVSGVQVPGHLLINPHWNE